MSHIIKTFNDRRPTKGRWFRWTRDGSDRWATWNGREDIIVERESLTGRWEATIDGQVWGTGHTRDMAARNAVDLYREYARLRDRV
jgi:hypothetical protein